MQDASPVRLLILGLLASGPLHGHQIRRTAELTGVETWGDVKVGALYGMLHRLESEGLIKPTGVEQAGNRPQRTVYAITDAGRTELAIHRDRALTQPFVKSTTVEAALKWLADLDHESLRARLEQRRDALQAKLAELVTSRDLHRRDDHLSAASLAGYRRAELHLLAELAWHDEIEALLPEIAAGDARDRAADEPTTAKATVTRIRKRRSNRS